MGIARASFHTACAARPYADAAETYSAYFQFFIIAFDGTLGSSSFFA
jgi:hypothetical protein